jgi:phosphoserine phosphatase
MGAADESQRQLDTLIDVSQQLAATIELDRLLKSVEQAALKVLDCERATVFLYDREADELFSKIATGVEEIRFSADAGIAGEAARTRKTIHVPDAYSDSRFNPEVDRTTGFKTRNLLTFVLVGYDAELMGVLQVLNKRSGSFDGHDERLADTLSALAGVAIQRQLLLEEYAEKKKLERDLDLAREIQRGYLPEADPEIEGFEVAGWNRPADQTGGDAYDFIRGVGQRLGLLIADATGHGIGPALMVAECRAFIRSSASTSQDVLQIMATANALLADDLTDGRFVTVCYAQLDPQEGCVEYLSAGQGPLLRYVACDDRFEEISADTVPMGILAHLPATGVTRLDMAPGDMFVMLTDGFYEWARPDRSQFGMERVCEVLRANRDRACAEMIRTLHAEVVRFGQGAPQSDDLTAILVKRLP